MTNEFETYKPDLTIEQVQNHLLTWKKRGFKVVRDMPQLTTGWVVILGRADQKIGVKPTEKEHFFTVHAGNLLRQIGTVTSLNELRDYFDTAACHLGIRVNEPPVQQATSAITPLSTWVKLNRMIGTATVDIIWDSYLDNKSLENISDLASIGSRFSPSLKLLTSKNKCPSKSFFQKFNIELSISAELRVAEKDHPRLIFLNNGICISIDFSLNKEQNGTIIVVECAPKKILFDTAWQAASQPFTNNKFEHRSI